MKKLYPLLSVLFLIYWGCDDPKEENKPTPVTITYFQDSPINVVIKWNMNEDTDFFRYSLYGSNNSSMENKTLIYETQTRLDTTYTLESNEYFSYFQVDVTSSAGTRGEVLRTGVTGGFILTWHMCYDTAA